jgi:dipeptidyl aminopeptidase/acylaminoacyl peptidase
MKPRLIALLVSALASILSVASVTGQVSLRPLVPDDINQIASIDRFSVAVAPQGDMVAFAIVGSRLHEGSEIWVAPLSGGEAIKLPGDDSINFIRSQIEWSPDGTRLMVMARSLDKTYDLYIWSRADKNLVKVGSRVFPALSTWLDDTHIVALRVPDRVSPANASRLSEEEVIMGQWQRQKQGREATSSVLDIGVKHKQAPEQEKVSLALIDVGSGSLKAIDEANEFSALVRSPDHRHIAILKDAGAHRLELASLSNEYDWGQLVFVNAVGRTQLVQDEARVLVRFGSFNWSTDGRSFAFVGFQVGDNVIRAYQGTTMGGQLRKLPCPDSAQVEKVTWADSRHLLVLTKQETGSKEKPASRRDWWYVSNEEVPKNLTAGLAEVPDEVRAVSGGRAAVGIISGELWRVDLDSGVWKNLTSSVDAKVERVQWPRDTIEWGKIRETPPQDAVVVLTANSELYQVDVRSGQLTLLVLPSREARLAAYRPEENTALFVASDSTGTSLSVLRGTNRSTVARVNKFLRDIRQDETRSFEYKSLNGEMLTADIILPAGYEPGKRYPLVTCVYPGEWHKDLLPPLFSDSAANVHLFSARGYAVLIPSMPLKPKGEVEDPMLRLPEGVLPAVDKVIEMGIADPNRLAVGGWSFGGYSTYGLIALTNRFRAAIALAGPSDLISNYGIFRAATRSEENLDMDEHSEGIIWSEGGQGRMGNPPWRDVGRYLRNSPIFYVDRIQTPVLMIQGDMDKVSITQGEEMFTALYRERKRARFVRYWGEGHVLLSPANITDSWHQMYAWLDEILDIKRDEKGNLHFEGDKVKSRNGAPPLTPSDYARFDSIARGETVAVKQ